MKDVIHLLPDSVANQIAAGEVVQRPSSVVKELVENAVDAGATKVQVVVADGGRTLIQVIDNGKGMSETDARLAFERHATSKISNADDLFALKTMGFRGEALASIVAVAQVELVTRRADDELGTCIVIGGSRLESQEPVAAPVGSNFKVKNLFFNIPARRKFLKSVQTELNNIITEFERVAPAPYEAFDQRLSRHTHQAHGIIGTRGYSIRDERRLPLALALNILGGPSANSLLNILLREKHGLSYNVEATYTPYSDTGIVGIYFSSDHDNAAQCVELIEREVDRLCREHITPRRLAIAKRQFVAQMAISMEANEGYMLGAGKSYLLYKDIDTLEEAYKKVMAITATQICDVAADCLGNLSRLIYK